MVNMSSAFELCYVNYSVAELAKALILKNAKYLYNVTLCFQIMYGRQQEMNTLRNEIYGSCCFFNTLRRRDKCESFCNILRLKSKEIPLKPTAE